MKYHIYLNYIFGITVMVIVVRLQFELYNEN